MRTNGVAIDYYNLLNSNRAYNELKDLYKNVVVKSLRIYGIKRIERPSVLFVKDRSVGFWYAISTGDFIDGEVKNYVDIENPTGTVTLACDGDNVEAIYFLIFEFRLDIGRLRNNNLNNNKMYGDNFSENFPRIEINSKNMLDLIENEADECLKLNAPQPVGLDISLNKSKVSKIGGSSKYNVILEDKNRFKKHNNELKLKKNEKARYLGNNNSRIIQPEEIDSSELSD